MRTGTAHLDDPDPGDDYQEAATETFAGTFRRTVPSATSATPCCRNGRRCAAPGRDGACRRNVVVGDVEPADVTVVRDKNYSHRRSNESP